VYKDAVICCWVLCRLYEVNLYLMADLLHMPFFEQNCSVSKSCYLNCNETMQLIIVIPVDV